MPLGSQLTRARELVGYSQDDAAKALGVSRAMVSYWESERRRPNDRQLGALARLYRVEIARLLSNEDLEPEVDIAQMLLRTETDVPEEAIPGVRDFVNFLDQYARLAVATKSEIRGLTQSPFISRSGFASADDARRKAEEVRSHLRLGLGPVPDVDWACEFLGITVFRAPLGDNLRRTISGAFLSHPAVGFAILVNLNMTPGRRRFTIVHELAHALFHSDKARYVVSRPTADPRERFADTFAGEFLMPGEGIRRFMEENGMGPRLDDPADVVHIQRYFKVSYPTALVRLRKSGALSAQIYRDFQHVRPVVLARALGYEIDDEEYAQDPELWRISRYPRGFLHMLRSAVRNEVISVPTAAALTRLSLDDITQLIGSIPSDAVPAESAVEIQQFEETGVVEATG
jgi:Zn-dependent peptidase ImmA (M78 family)/transcriptional regulator with XRE-family HTH domain